MAQTEEKVAIGWKDIADMMGVSTKTARRWHRIHKVPVRFVGRKATLNNIEYFKWQRSRQQTITKLKA